MPEQKKLTTLPRQLAEKPKVEDRIPHFLDGDMQKNALDFVAWLRANKMNPALSLIDKWQITCKGKPLCCIRLLHLEWGNMRQDRKWGVQLYRHNISKYEEVVLSEGLHPIIWDNITPCVKCRKCAPGMNVNLLGKEFKNICVSNNSTWIYDPSETTINGIKRLLELEKNARLGNVSR